MNNDGNRDRLQLPFDDAGCDALILSRSAAQCSFHGTCWPRKLKMTDSSISHIEDTCCLDDFDDHGALVRGLDVEEGRRQRAKF